MLGVILMDGVKEIILQTKNVEYIKRNLGKEQWIQVSSTRQIGCRALRYWSGLRYRRDRTYKVWA